MTGGAQPVFAFHSMIKPAGAQCNIDCGYCFYLHKEDLLAQPRTPRMSDAVLEAHIRQYIEAQTAAEVVFTWQGGEPTLPGLDFYRKAVALQRRYAKPGQRILNDLQTNGLLLDDEWCAFLKQEGFLVGLSVDGPAHLHNRLRQTKNAKPTFDMVMRAVRLLHRYAVPFHALCVVNAYNAREPLAVYRFLRDEVRPRMIQFLSAVEPLDFRHRAPPYFPQGKKTIPLYQDTAAAVTEWSVKPQDWGSFLTAVWQEWLAHDYGRVFVDQFENSISQALGSGAQKCTTAPICGKAVALEHNGDLYSCDHFVYPGFKLGNILHTHQGRLAFSRRQQAFAYAKHLTLPQECRSCSYLKLCWGECPKNRFVRTANGETGMNYLCSGLKAFYRRVCADLPLIEERLKRRHKPAAPA